MGRRVRGIPPRSELFRAYMVKEQTLRQMAEHYGVAIGTVRRWLAYHDLELRRRGAPEDPQSPTRLKAAENHRRRVHRQRLKNLEKARKARKRAGYSDGRPPLPAPEREELRMRAKRATLGELAEHYGRDRRTVKRWLERYELPVPDGRRRASVPSRAEVEALHETMTLAELGAHYNVSRQRVHQWLKEGRS